MGCRAASRGLLEEGGAGLVTLPRAAEGAAATPPGGIPMVLWPRTRRSRRTHVAAGSDRLQLQTQQIDLVVPADRPSSRAEWAWRGVGGGWRWSSAGRGRPSGVDVEALGSTRDTDVCKPFTPAGWRLRLGRRCLCGLVANKLKAKKQFWGMGATMEDVYAAQPYLPPGAASSLARRREASD